MSEPDRTDEFYQALAAQGFVAPSLIEKIGAIGDDVRRAELLRREIMVDMSARKLRLEHEAMERAMANAFMVGAQIDKHELMRRAKSLGIDVS